MKRPRDLLGAFLLVLLLSLILLYIAVLFRFALEMELWGSRGSFQRFALNLFLWEALLAVSVSYVFYKLFVLYENHRREQEAFLKLLLLSVSHKFGNFLAGQKVNLALLAQEPSPETVKRLRANLESMEEDLQRLLQTLTYLLEEREPRIEEEPEERLKAILFRLERTFGSRKVTLRLGRAFRNFWHTLEGELLLFFLLENAFRYSAKKIYLRGGCFRGHFYFAILNDYGRGRSGEIKGGGLGLYLSRRLASHLGFTFRAEPRKAYFAALLSHPLPRKFHEKIMFLPRRSGKIL